MSKAKPSDPFVKAIDDAMRMLLERASGGGSVPEGSEKERITLSEQVKAFSAAVEWAEKRAKIMPAPPEPPPAKNGADHGFGRLRANWNDEARGGGTSATGEEDDAD